MCQLTDFVQLIILYFCVYVGVKPGGIGIGSRKRQRPASFPMNTSTRHTCPVINCGRVYDNASLLDGHLKRYSFSVYFHVGAIPFEPFLELKYGIFCIKISYV